MTPITLQHTSSSAELITSQLGYALAVARKRARLFPSLADEFESAAMLTLVEAAQRYRPEMDVPFRIYFGWVLHRRMIDVLRNERKSRVLAEWPGCFDGVEARSSAAADDDSDTLDYWCGGLSARSREVIRMHFFEGLKLWEIAAPLGVPKSTISTIYRNAIRRIRERETERSDR